MSLSNRKTYVDHFLHSKDCNINCRCRKGGLYCSTIFSTAKETVRMLSFMTLMKTVTWTLLITNHLLNIKMLRQGSTSLLHTYIAMQLCIFYIVSKSRHITSTENVFFKLKKLTKQKASHTKYAFIVDSSNQTLRCFQLLKYMPYETKCCMRIN